MSGGDRFRCLFFVSDERVSALFSESHSYLSVSYISVINLRVRREEDGAKVSGGINIECEAVTVAALTEQNQISALIRHFRLKTGERVSVGLLADRRNVGVIERVTLLFPDRDDL